MIYKVRVMCQRCVYVCVLDIEFTDYVARFKSPKCNCGNWHVEKEINIFNSEYKSQLWGYIVHDSGSILIDLSIITVEIPYD